MNLCRLFSLCILINRPFHTTHLLIKRILSPRSNRRPSVVPACIDPRARLLTLCSLVLHRRLPKLSTCHISFLFSLRSDDRDIQFSSFQHSLGLWPLDAESPAVNPHRMAVSKFSFARFANRRDLCCQVLEGASGVFQYFLGGGDFFPVV